MNAPKKQIIKLIRIIRAIIERCSTVDGLVGGGLLFIW